MENAQPKPLGILVCRLFWVLLGPVRPILDCRVHHDVQYRLAHQQGPVFGVLLLSNDSLSLGRFLKGEGTNALGDPVTQRYMLGYTVIALVAGVAVWAAANVLGNHLL